MPIDAALAASVAGRYGFPGREVTFTDEGGRLFADYPDGVRSEVFATGPDTLFFKVKPWAMTVVRDGDRVARLEIGEGGGAYRAERVD